MDENTARRQRTGFRTPVLLLLLLLVTGCGGGGDSTAAPGGQPVLTVVATTGMIADVVRNIVGERANVTGLIGEGVDPHLYKPTRSDIAALTGADVVFYNGLLLEGKMTDAFERAGASEGTHVFAVAELLDPETLLAPPEFEGHNDPHVWGDPLSWKKVAEGIRDRLVEVDPEGKSTYERNATTYLAELDAVHAYAEQVLGTVPEGARALVTAHDAFNYFGRRYGYEVVGLQGLSTESEAGVRDIETLVDTVVTRKIPAVFVESTVSERNIKALVQGAKARGHQLRIGGNLFSDAMGRPGSYEGTYVGMIDHNVTTVARALGGDAPERGMRGELGQGAE